ncbi:MAG TPA: helix-turn-helix transcriptional regulator [Pseudonocardiaceae bacterium]|jgi:hypothetical protein|nr:helix-turn-helix transcriptional regulator [Pseudonocardiaceae bacterium]
MADTTSTVRSRELGEGLRAALERATLTGKRAAELIGWSETKLSRVLSGQITVTEVDVAAFLGLCTVRGPERERLLRLAREQDHRGWLQPELKTLVDHENKAVKITDFHDLLIPGLLQTSNYMRAVFERSAVVTAGDIESRISARMARQNLFDHDRRPQFIFYLHESALRLPVGGLAVMSDQLHYLLRMGVRTCITIRVIPSAFGAHAGSAGSCRLMEFAEFTPVVYVEEATVGHFLEEPVEIDTYQKIFAALANCALDEGESNALIAQIAVDLFGDREDRHGYP